MRRSTVLLQNLSSLVVWNVMSSKYVLVIEAVDAAVRSADTPILDVTSNYEFSSTKLDCFG